MLFLQKFIKTSFMLSDYMWVLVLLLLLSLKTQHKVLVDCAEFHRVVTVVNTLSLPVDESFNPGEEDDDVPEE